MTQSLSDGLAELASRQRVNRARAAAGAQSPVAFQPQPPSQEQQLQQQQQEVAVVTSSTAAAGGPETELAPKPRQQTALGRQPPPRDASSPSLHGSARTVTETTNSGGGGGGGGGGGPDAATNRASIASQAKQHKNAAAQVPANASPSHASRHAGRGANAAAHYQTAASSVSVAASPRPSSPAAAAAATAATGVGSSLLDDQAAVQPMALVPSLSGNVNHGARDVVEPVGELPVALLGSSMPAFIAQAVEQLIEGHQRHMDAVRCQAESIAAQQFAILESKHAAELAQLTRTLQERDSEITRLSGMLALQERQSSELASRLHSSEEQCDELNQELARWREQGTKWREFKVQFEQRKSGRQHGTPSSTPTSTSSRAITPTEHHSRGATVPPRVIFDEDHTATILNKETSENTSADHRAPPLENHHDVNGPQSPHTPEQLQQQRQGVEDLEQINSDAESPESPTTDATVAGVSPHRQPSRALSLGARPQLTVIESEMSESFDMFVARSPSPVVTTIADIVRVNGLEHASTDYSTATARLSLKRPANDEGLPAERSKSPRLALPTSSSIVIVSGDGKAASLRPSTSGGSSDGLPAVQWGDRPQASAAFKYVEVVRNREARDRLPAAECNECEKFFAGQSHLQGKNFQHVCRHKHVSLPPKSPEGFWNVDFAATQGSGGRSACNSMLDNQPSPSSQQQDQHHDVIIDSDDQ
ncbi:hypothetical protein CAOG_01257 [Capsaspora owczarzaki ATCC 30864]|uniref:DNA endonuclease activator Ctp1 C-terminal domain-containing protein n=1 Tax=Capsaspora owczarzaki (strain ATCC 30864) TaxID=595528 RepID=A0A0D2WJZ7_CAPO3|nr:hypothetical protein CAOG_01257 [Capsaspora owczarzaki ATCC 30864]KJE89833.1 hypothetical protein CAOG_001257 [Capsaspora owczarzaki ATCC 30864]|eukprot:XP_004349777.2 hypothetical protein CAOG_01257 [Capsaspora owczarzaki ATCC 30864]